MKYIRHVLIENFQSHERTELDFGPGLNVIVGPSDHGKSAILRAIRWALYNEPRGTDFVRTGARACRVTVTMSDGAEVIREVHLGRSGSAARSRYIVRIPGEEPRVFEGFGTQVPAEVLRAHGMPQVLLDTDKRVLLNLGSQLEGPFLLAESGSFRARALGRLLGVHVVDAAVRDTQRDLRAVRQEVAQLEARLEEFDEELKQYADLPALEEQLERAEAAVARAEALDHRLQRLQSIREELIRTEREQEFLRTRLQALRDLAQAEHRLKEAEERHRQAVRLERLRDDLSRVEQEIRRTKARLDVLTALPLAEQRAREAAERQSRLTGLLRVEAEWKRREDERRRLEGAVARLQQVPRAAGLLEEAARLQQRLERLQECLAQWRDVEDRIARGTGMLRDVEAQLERHLGALEEILTRTGRCPTCLQPVEPAAVRRILAELAGGGPAHPPHGPGGGSGMMNRGGGSHRGTGAE
ncbi:MAG TPA: AAA family ATPase [Symbiobacteriaceae bacterium]